MLKLLVIKLHARINISFLCFTKIKPLKSYEKMLFLSLLKVVPGIVIDVAEKQKQFHRIFDNPPAKYLSSKEFLEGIDYISSYLPKSE